MRNVIYWPENLELRQLAKVHGGNPILFPFSGRNFHKGKVGYWKDAKGVVRAMPKNGFATVGSFEPVRIDESGFSTRFKPDDIAQEAYPFNYKFTVRYVFEAVSFKVYLQLVNLGDEPIFWSAGHHFYFTLPWHDGLERRDYRFERPAKKCFTQAPDGSLLPVDKGCDRNISFGDPAINERIYTRLKGSTAVFGPNGGEEDIGIHFLEDSDTYSSWNAFVLSTESADSPFYCVQPWMSPPNSMEHGKGRHAVSAGNRATFGVEVALL
ncbi:MAG: aldose epimerase [Verrucomicrobiota bacterium]|nr:aldose epimerase [Verrucomicrobiota bacterium]